MRYLKLTPLIIVLAFVSLTLGFKPATAAMTDLNGCMQDIAGFSLNCTANDVVLAGANNIKILDDGCAYPGDEVTFEADFQVVLNAKERYDIGIYFGTDGDINGDGALTGTCSISTLDYEGSFTGGLYVDLDGDTCGDINALNSPLSQPIQITTKCIGNENNKLILPYCTSWRQSGANEYCNSPLLAYPGSPSKCKCDPGFIVDIDVPSATLEVTKTAAPPEVDEPGELVTFMVVIKTTAILFLHLLQSIICPPIISAALSEPY